MAERRIHEKRQWTLLEMYYFLALCDRYQFILIFWKDELTIPHDRLDLPAEWRGKQVITLEQRNMMLDDAPKVQFCTSRKIGKTLILEGYYFHVPLMNLADGRARDGLFHAPREVQRDPVINRIEERANHVPLFSMLRQSFNKGEQIFKFRGGFTWHNRIEGNPATAGRNMVGLRASIVMGDEGAYGNDAAFGERTQTAMPAAREIWAGVPNGIRGTKFHRISETEEGRSWSRHRYNILASPLYHSLPAWKRLIEDHNGAATQTFITQVLGQWGEATVASFAILPHSDRFPFTHRQLTGQMIVDHQSSLAILLDIKIPQGYDRFVLGGDLGYSPSPTVLTLMVEAEGSWWEFAKVEMLVANSVMQAWVIDAMCMKSLPKPPLMGCLDAHGRGEGVLASLQTSPEFNNAYYKEFFVDAGFAGMMPDERIQLHKKCGQRVRQGHEGTHFCDQCKSIVSYTDLKPAVVPTKQHLTVALKEAFLYGQQHLDDWEARHGIVSRSDTGQAGGDE